MLWHDSDFWTHFSQLNQFSLFPNQIERKSEKHYTRCHWIAVLKFHSSISPISNNENFVCWNHQLINVQKVFHWIQRDEKWNELNASMLRKYSCVIRDSLYATLQHMHNIYLLLIWNGFCLIPNQLKLSKSDAERSKCYSWKQKTYSKHHTIWSPEQKESCICSNWSENAPIAKVESCLDEKNRIFVRNSVELHVEFSFERAC